jgi:hypothetical protein
MSMLDGLTECWLLSAQCGANWDAWSAIGTVAATAVALGFGVHSLITQASSARKRAVLAKSLLKALGERLFDEVEAIGSNDGVANGRWDAKGHTLNFVLASATKLKSICQSAETLLLDADEKVIDSWASVLGESRGLAEDVLSLEKHSRSGQKQVATHVTQAHYEVAETILRRENSALISVGGRAIGGRTLVPRELKAELTK